MSGFRGWANGATHAVKYLFFDVYTHLGYFDDPRDHADALREYVEEYIVQHTSDPVVRQFALAYLSGVRWDQIAEALEEEYAEGDEE